MLIAESWQIAGVMIPGACTLTGTHLGEEIVSKASWTQQSLLILVSSRIPKISSPREPNF